MSVKVHEAFSIDSFQDRLLWWDDFLGDQLKDEWNRGGDGTSVVVDAQTGGIVRLTTGALDTNVEYIDWGNIRSLHVDQKVTMEVRVKLSTTSDIYPFIALFFDFPNSISFRYDTNAPDTNWMIRTVNGGVPTTSDSGIAPTTNYVILRIECFPTDEVHFYIDGVETANSPITTNIPDDAADYLQPRFWLRTHEDVAKTIDVDYVVLRQEI